jgi:hypothetical protein
MKRWVDAAGQLNSMLCFWNLDVAASAEQPPGLAAM